MTRVLVIDYEKCVGCRTCETACSMQHEGVVSPARSRIEVIKWAMEGEGVPIACAHCEPAPCATICPVRAISRDEHIGRVVVDETRCIGCRMCVSVCPFGAMGYDSKGKRVFKCDLCDGDPRCARLCMYGALRYVDASQQSRAKQREAAGRLKKLAPTALSRGFK